MTKQQDTRTGGGKRTGRWSSPGAQSPIFLGPNPISGLIDCPAHASFADLVDHACASGWSTDGLHPEAADATIGSLLERIQPRPLHWECSLLASRCRRIVARQTDGRGYSSTVSPRKASGPDLAYLFIGGEGRFGTIERASLALCRPAGKYLLAEGRFDEVTDLFAAARQICLLDPLSLRLLDATGQTLRAYLPARTATTRHFVESLEPFGLHAVEVDEIPRQERMAPPPAEGLGLSVSASYRTVSELVREALDRRGRRNLSVRFEYSDCHGLMVTFTMAPSNREILEELRRNALSLKDIHYIELAGESPGGEPAFLSVMEPPGEGGRR